MQNSESSRQAPFSESNTGLSALQPLSEQQPQRQQGVHYEGEFYISPPEVPRSVFRGSALPRSGEEILPVFGKPHAIVELLTEHEQIPQSEFSRGEPFKPGESTVSPPISTHALLLESFEERGRTGLEAPMPSPVSTSPVRAAAPIPITAINVPASRNILFIYPPRMTVDKVSLSLEEAVNTVIRPLDRIVFAWTPSQKSLTSSGPLEESEPIEPEVFTVGESASPNEQDIRVWANQFQEVTKVLRENTPVLHQLVENPLLKHRSFEIRIHSHASIWNTIKAEVDTKTSVRRWPSEKQRNYDFVVLPCLKPEVDSDTELEEFLITESRFPVVLMRV